MINLDYFHERRDLTVTCLALKEWVEGIPTIDIEKKYGLWCGSLYEVARQVSRLTRAYRDIARKIQRIFEAEIQITVNLRRQSTNFGFQMIWVSWQKWFFTVFR